MLASKISHLKKGARICIDEIQKVPLLLDEVHELIESKGYVFILTGSSARKLRRTSSNLLGGRAQTRRMFKASHRWRSEFEKPSRALREKAKAKHQKMYGVYLGNEVLTFGDFQVFPLKTFIEMLQVGSLY